MHIHSKQDMAVIQFIKELFSSIPTVSVLDGYPEESLEVPCVVIELDGISTYVQEMGTRTLGRSRMWFIDVYASSKVQRDEMAFMVVDALEKKIPVYDYDLGFPPTVVPKLGVLDPDDIQLKVIKVLPELTELMYYRAVVTFTAVFDNI